MLQCTRRYIHLLYMHAEPHTMISNFSTAFMKWLIPEKLENFLLWWEHPLLLVELDTALESRPKHSVVTIINANILAKSGWTQNWIPQSKKIFSNKCPSTLTAYYKFWGINNIRPQLCKGSVLKFMHYATHHEVPYCLSCTHSLNL